MNKGNYRATFRKLRNKINSPFDLNRDRQSQLLNQLKKIPLSNIWIHNLRRFLLADRSCFLFGLLSIWWRVWVVFDTIRTHNSTTLQSHNVRILCNNIVRRYFNSQILELGMKQSYVVIKELRITPSKRPKIKWSIDRMTVQSLQNGKNGVWWIVNKQKTII